MHEECWSNDSKDDVSCRMNTNKANSQPCSTQIVNVTRRNSQVKKFEPLFVPVRQSLGRNFPNVVIPGFFVGA